MKLFRTPQAMYAEITDMETHERNRREDRATTSEFYNGAPPLSDSEAEDLGFTQNTNHLYGYVEIAQVKEQNFGMLTKPSRMLELELDAAPPGLRANWSMCAGNEANRVLRKIRKFKPHYEGICGDGALHGEAVLFHGTGTFPLPKQVPLSKMLVPHKAPADPHRLTHWVIVDDIDLAELTSYWRRKAKGWNKENLSYAIKQIYEGKVLHPENVSPENVEEAEYERQTNSFAGSSMKTSLEVYYFYERRTDDDSGRIDLTILLKDNKAGLTEKDGEKLDRGVLYKKEGCYPNVDACLHPYFADCIIGGAPLWHRVLGTGTLNYSLNFAIELLINRAMQGTIEGTMNLWKAKDAVTRDEIQQILLKHNGVIPENVELLPNRFPMDFQGILGMIQFYRQQGSKNARGVTPNNGDKNDQLEVQAMFEQNASAATQNSRTSNWYDYHDRTLDEAVARLANPFIEPFEPGYSEAMDFQAAMERRGIPLYYLQRHNIRVRAVRLLGDGLRSKEIAIAQHLTQTRNQHPPQVQAKIGRIVDAIMLDNYELAEELNPMGEDEQETKGIDPNSENAIMLTQRTALKPHAADVPEVHVLTHFGALEQLISDGIQFQKSAFTPQQLDSFQKIGTHTIQHIQNIEGRAVNSRSDPDREKAKQFMSQMNEYAALAEKLQQNMQQAQEGQEQEPMSQAEMAKLQLSSEQLKLQREKLMFSMEKFARQQGNREQTQAFEQMLKLESDRRQGEESRRKAVLDDTKMALDIATKTAKAAAPTA